MDAIKLFITRPVFTAMLVLYHVPATTAAGAAVAYHAIALWIPALAGTYAFVRLRRSRAPLVLRPGREERAQVRRDARAVR